MMSWIWIGDCKPTDGQKVWYYFHHEEFGFTILERGEYEEHGCIGVKLNDDGTYVDGWPYEKLDGTWGTTENGKAPDAKVWLHDTFGNDTGWLTDDVTHWMPDTGQSEVDVGVPDGHPLPKRLQN
tara:strand:- start:35 stop:409 length:375 start_codon:yes stop_codon:yes gene_type:complete